MVDTTNDVPSFIDKREKQLSESMEKIYSAAQPGAVYSEPVACGSYTVIAASEVTAAGGFGSGLGFGPATKPPKEQSSENSTQHTWQPMSAGGGSIGGGGSSTGHPVAVIIIGPEGVTIKPVIDVTKLALAVVTAWGVLMMTLRRRLNRKKP